MPDGEPRSFDIEAKTGTTPCDSLLTLKGINPKPQRNRINRLTSILPG
jgi:hypothetical protein